jgi:hypothetical protein
MSAAAGTSLRHSLEKSGCYFLAPCVLTRRLARNYSIIIPKVKQFIHVKSTYALLFLFYFALCRNDEAFSFDYESNAFLFT